MVLSLCVEQGLLAALGSHLYLWRQEVRRQEEGLAIGLDLARAAARLFMLEWDRMFLQLVRDNFLTLYHYSRYLDDTGNGVKAIPLGMRWSEKEGRMIIHPGLVEQDRDIPGDLRTMREVVKMANSITTFSPLIFLLVSCTFG